MSLSHYYIYFYVGKFSRGIGYFYPTKYIPSAELPDEEYQTILMTGRILYYYTTRVMTGRTEELMKIAPSSFIEINIKINHLEINMIKLNIDLIKKNIMFLNI